jgi:hypothetical protein
LDSLGCQVTNLALACGHLAPMGPRGPMGPMGAHSPWARMGPWGPHGPRGCLAPCLGRLEAPLEARVGLGSPSWVFGGQFAPYIICFAALGIQISQNKGPFWANKWGPSLRPKMEPILGPKWGPKWGPEVGPILRPQNGIFGAIFVYISRSKRCETNSIRAQWPTWCL